MKINESRILVVDDEPRIVEVVKAYLEKSNYKVFAAYDGEQALKMFDEVKPNLVVLDLMLPKISGEQICQTIRRKSRIPIIMLTAKSQEYDKINGFNIGADDYVTKPFSPKELVVRVDSLLRRCNEGISPLFNIMSWNNNELIINFTEMTVKKDGETVRLTPNEFKLLSTIVKYPKKVYSREELIDIAFGIDFDGYERTIDSHVKNLRSKIETDSSNPKYILTVRGIGYKFGCVE
ncbi:MAG TPA: response regulator transcription factor [Epulopiscium sp.]|nr:response regulator transcription factor [Candidatus Epulonipiscium sp.]